MHRENEIPISQWPFKKGRWVYFINPYQSHGSGYFRLRKGKVKFYNPAIKSSLLVTAGHPFYNLNEDGKETSTLVSANNVFPVTKAGKRAAQVAIRESMFAEVARLRDYEARLNKEANESP